MTAVTEHWQIRKPAVTTTRGLVASQHYMASDVGADVLRRGGNAIDAAIAAGLTLGTVEPWMSGIGGGGYMTVYLARSNSFKVVEFGMRAPFESVPEDYPLAGDGENATDAFNWPRVVGDTNIHGPLAAAVPGYIKGVSLTLREFGTWDWKQVIEPACRHAEQGLPVDWFSAQKINHWARGLATYDETRSTYLADGLPPVANLDGTLAYLKLGRLADTYRHLQEAGPDTYYSGSLAQSMVADLQACGSRISLEDLKDYTASITEPLTTTYRGSTLYTAGNLTAGPSIIHALNELETGLSPDGNKPDGAAYIQYARALFSAYEDRLENLGEGPDTKVPGNTSHLCAIDEEGNVVSLTQTIMSAFGSRIMLPGSGILMNNGMMWFDPRPGGPNSVVGGRRPLCNMCPVIARSGSGDLVAIGACGGRKIFPAVFQLMAFATDYDMTLEEAAHHARIDVSGTDQVTAMSHMDPASLAELSNAFPEMAVRPNGVNPNHFALPQIVKREAGGDMTGCCFIPSPHAKVSTAD